MDLHEGYDYHKLNKDSVGQSVIMHKGTAAQHAARDKVVSTMIAAANKSKQIRPSFQPPAQSDCQQSGQSRRRLFRRSRMIIETSRKQPLSLRIEQHETMVSTAMRELGML